MVKNNVRYVCVCMCHYVCVSYLFFEDVLVCTYVYV